MIHNVVLIVCKPFKKKTIQTYKKPKTAAPDPVQEEINRNWTAGQTSVPVLPVFPSFLWISAESELPKFWRELLL